MQSNRIKGCEKKQIGKSEGEEVNDFGILRAWGARAFWNFGRQGGGGWGESRITMLPMVGYGYFLESPNNVITHTSVCPTIDKQAVVILFYIITAY